MAPTAKTTCSDEPIELSLWEQLQSENPLATDDQLFELSSLLISRKRASSDDDQVPAKRSKLGKTTPSPPATTKRVTPFTMNTTRNAWSTR